MTKTIATALALSLTANVVMADAEKVAAYLAERETEFDQIPPERLKELQKLADFVRQHKPARLLFVCTHNSRRSQLGQVWAAAAAEYYGVPNVSTYSGGTESTAFNPRAVAALNRAGVEVT